MQWRLAMAIYCHICPIAIASYEATGNMYRAVEKRVGGKPKVAIGRKATQPPKSSRLESLARWSVRLESQFPPDLIRTSTCMQHQSSNPFRTVQWRKSVQNYWGDDTLCADM